MKQASRTLSGEDEINYQQRTAQYLKTGGDLVLLVSSNLEGQAVRLVAVAEESMPKFF